MGLITTLFGRKARRAPDDDYWYMPMWGQASATGERVDSTTALANSAVFACVRAVTETLSTLPLHVYRRNRDEGRTRRIDTDHYLGEVLLRPNPYMTRVDFLDWLQHCIEMRGESFVEIQWTGRGNKVQYLWPVANERVQDVRLDGNAVVYDVRQASGAIQTVPQRNMLHVKFMPVGLRGRSPIQYAADTIGVGMAGLKYGAKVFAGDGLKRMALVMDGQPPQREGDRGKAFMLDTLEAWKQAYGGMDHAHKVALLHSGLRPQEIGLSPEDAQLLELMNANAVDVCRIFRVPPHKIQLLDRAHFNNIEHQQIDWVTDTLMPRAIRLEHAINAALLPQDKDYFIKLNLEGLLRGDYKSRMEGHSIAIQNGIMSPNEARDEEDRNPYDGGDVYLIPLNMATAGDEEQPGVDGESDTKALECDEKETRAATRLKERMKLREQWLPVITEAYERLLKREASEIDDAAEKYLEKDFDVIRWEEWIAGYKESHAKTVEKIVGPPALALDKALVDALLDEGRAAGHGEIELRDMTPHEWVEGWTKYLGKQRAAKVAAAIRKVWFGAIAGDYSEARRAEALKKIKGLIERWVDQAEGLAGDHVVQCDGAIAREIWRMQGISKVRWEGGTCDFCVQLNGKVVGVEGGSFVPKGESVNAEGQVPIWAGADVMNPPLHPHCQCYLVIES